jgi:FdhD protein
LLGNTACGLCGVESLAELHRRAEDRVGPVVPVTDAAIRRAFAALPMHQPLNAATRSVHAAAWCDLDGAIRLVREDVGRHNALDKLIGALARTERLQDPGFVVMSSRCSYELVSKAAAANTQLLATVSAPTSLALDWAAALQLPLAGCVRSGAGDRVVRFSARATEATDAG